MSQIIIIEDGESLIRAYAALIQALNQKEKSLQAIFLKDLDSAEAYLEDSLPNQPNIAAIVFDGSMNCSRQSLNTRHLVRLAKEANFTGVMVANSSDPRYNDLLAEEGCTHISPEKGGVIEYLFGLLF